MESLYYIKLSDDAYDLTRETKGSAGLDIFSPVDEIIPPYGCKVIKSGLSVQTPRGTYARISPCSLNAINLLHVAGGVVDPDYRGNVAVILYNHGRKPYKINRGDKIAQIIVEKYSHCAPQELKRLSTTDRGNKGVLFYS